MRVGIIQPNYIPWRGYFDFIDDVDVFIVYNDVQYTKNDWRNRNKLKVKSGAAWITVPVMAGSLGTLVCDTSIDWRKDWPARHKALLYENYRRAPFYGPYLEMLTIEIERKHRTIAELDVALIRRVAVALGITTPIVLSSDLHIPIGARQERIISLVKAVGGTTYLSGPAAMSYIVPETFLRAGIALEYKVYDYGPYPQLWDDFDGSVSILDLLMNTGEEARRHLKSRMPNRSMG